MLDAFLGVILFIALLFFFSVIFGLFMTAVSEPRPSRSPRAVHLIRPFPRIASALFHFLGYQQARLKDAEQSIEHKMAIPEKATVVKTTAKAVKSIGVMNTLKAGWKMLKIWKRADRILSKDKHL